MKTRKLEEHELSTVELAEKLGITGKVVSVISVGGDVIIKTEVD